MRRHDKPLPKLPDLPDRPASSPASCELGPYLIEVITPIVGGGARSRLPDPVSVVRPQSVRGHLRFWWRATTGARYDTIAQMREAEAAIFGSTSLGSRVKVSVEITHSGEDCKIGEWFIKQAVKDGGATNKTDDQFLGGIPPYAAFPFRPEESKKPKPVLEQIEKSNIDEWCSVRHRVQFKIHLSCVAEISDRCEELKSAVRAWVHFGGIGSRTRRGFGALYCKTLNDLGFATALIKTPRWLKPEDEIRPPVVLQRGFSNHATIESAWDAVIGDLRSFRQGLGIGRAQGTNKPNGRSNWPEAETVRKLILKKRGDKPRPRVWHPEQPAMPQGFPRAEFGLPIIFEIRDEDISELVGDEDQGMHLGKNIKPTLLPLVGGKAMDRWASPIVLRPIVVSRDNEKRQYGVLVLMLPHLPLSMVQLKRGSHDLPTSLNMPSSVLRGDRMNRLIPMRHANSSRNDDGSAVMGFLHFLQNDRPYRVVNNV